MSKAYYWKKELLNAPIRLDGNLIQFEPVGQNTGVKRIEGENNDPIIAALEGFADQRKRGITRISPEIYESLKKNHSENQPSRQPNGLGTQLRVFDREASLFPSNPKAGSAAGANPAAVVSNIPVVPSAEDVAAPKKAFAPRLGKASGLDKPKSE